MSAKAEQKKEKGWIAIAAILAVTIIAAVVANIVMENGVSSTTAVGSLDLDTGDEGINWGRYNNYEVKLDDLAEDYYITVAGVYHLTGATDKMIVVKAGEDKVKLVLDNVEIKCADGPAIYVVSADDTVIELVGENVLVDSENYRDDLDEDVNGVIFSKDDLSFMGEGSLELTGNYQDGIVSKDDLKFNSGNYQIVAADDGIRGKDSVYILGGDFKITAGTDGIKSTNTERAGKGFVYIVDGNLEITAEKQGIDAAMVARVDGGKLKISGYEGIEAQKIMINGGDLNIAATDDGMNASSDSSEVESDWPGAGMAADEDCVLVFNGGTTYVNAVGDGVDSNGMIYFNGGTVIVDGPTTSANGALDSGSSIVMNGGTVIAVGASGMAESLGSSGATYNVSVYFDATMAAGTKVEILDSEGNVVIEHTSAKTFNHMAAGLEKFTKGAYVINVNGEKYEEFEFADEKSVTVGTATGMSGGMMEGGMMNGGVGGEMNGEMPEMPSDMDMKNMPTGGTTRSGKK